MKLTDPAADLVKAHAEKWTTAPEKESEKAAEKAEKDAIKAARAKAWKAPKTKAARKKLRDEREAAWLGGDA